jgi:hypothetical protein
MSMKIFPLSDPILLPLAPTIAGEIATYLQLLTQQVYVRSSHKYDNLATDSVQDGSWHWQYQSSMRLVTTSPYQYVSTIAHRLAAKSSFNSVEICHNFGALGSELEPKQGDLGNLCVDKKVNSNSQQPLQPELGSIESPILEPGLVLELDCWYNEAGYIYFQVTAESIGKWLSYIHDLPLKLDLNPHLSHVSSMAVYAHARCCSVLKLAAVERLVVITDAWQIVEPIFSHERLMLGDRSCRENLLGAATNFIFEHPTEQRLIQVLMRVLDSIYEHNLDKHDDLDRCNLVGTMQRNSIGHRHPNWSKLTLDLAQSWLDFYRDCRIFGDLANQNPRLAIARCGLSAIVRRYLQLLLENYLGIHATIEL